MVVGDVRIRVHPNEVAAHTCREWLGSDHGLDIYCEKSATTQLVLVGELGGQSLWWRCRQHLAGSMMQATHYWPERVLVLFPVEA